MERYDIRIPDFVYSDSDKCTFFKILVAVSRDGEDKKWSVRRRYNEFVSLHSSVRRRRQV